MEAAHNRYTMSTWEPVQLHTSISEDFVEETQHVSALGLEAEPQQLHAEFHAVADHDIVSSYNHTIISSYRHKIISSYDHMKKRKIHMPLFGEFSRSSRDLIEL